MGADKFITCLGIGPFQFRSPSLSHSVTAKARRMQRKLPGYVQAQAQQQGASSCPRASPPPVSATAPATVGPRADTACSIWLLEWKRGPKRLFPGFCYEKAWVRMQPWGCQLDHANVIHKRLSNISVSLQKTQVGAEEVKIKAVLKIMSTQDSGRG